MSYFEKPQKKILDLAITIFIIGKCFNFEYNSQAQFKGPGFYGL